MSRFVAVCRALKRASRSVSPAARSGTLPNKLTPNEATPDKVTLKKGNAEQRGLTEAAAARRTVVGLVADTHGLLRPELLAAFAGVDLVVHAGDVGNEAVLRGLETLAPVLAVRGNVDRGAWAARLPRSVRLEVGGIKIYVYHGDEALESAPAGCRVVVRGHSHRPETIERGGVLYLNPGSAGPRRFKLPVTAMRLSLEDGAVNAELLELVG